MGSSSGLSLVQIYLKHFIIQDSLLTRVIKETVLASCGLRMLLI